MEENMSCLAEVNSIICLNKKRKSQAEMPETPLPKHVCWDQTRLEHDSSSKNVEIDHVIITRGESDPQSSKDSNSFHGDPDSFMSPSTETNTSEPSTSFASNWGEASSITDLYSLESRSLTKSRCSKPESLSISEELDYSSYNYEEEDHLMEFGSGADCSLSGYRDEQFNPENLLYSNGVAESSYVLSSDTQQGARKLTIDKEFEQYFSSLML